MNSLFRIPHSAFRIGTWLVLAALLSASVLALARVSAGVDLRGMEQHRKDSDTATLDATTSIAQSFRSPRGNLASIELELGTMVGLNPEGRIRLLAGDGLAGQAVYEASLDEAGFDKNPFLTIRFPPIATSEGAVYTLVLETPGKSLSSAIGIRYNSFDALTSGRMYLDGEPGEGDLAIATYYHYDVPMLLGDIGDALSRHGALMITWLALLLLPGMALLLWLPNSLSAGQRILAAPGLSALALPVFLLVTRALRIALNGVTMWLIILLSAAAIALYIYRYRSPKSKVQGPKSKVQGPKSKVNGLSSIVRRLSSIPHSAFRIPHSALSGLAFWGLLCGVVALTLLSRLVALRDAYAGMGLDAYHHTLIPEMFVRQGGIPSDYEPYAPLASFTYHYGFHALIAAIGWLTARTAPTDMLLLMPQAGQIATTLPVITLTLFAWRVLGDRWAGLAAGALAGLVSIFPAFYVNWSRYTQGLGLALLPVALVLLLEALQWPAQPVPPTTQKLPMRSVVQRSGPVMLAVIAAAGLALTHYRIAMIYVGFAALYLLWTTYALVRARKSPAEVVRPLWRVLLVAALTLAAWSPWLANLSQNFGARFVGKSSPVAEGYYSLKQMVGESLLNHYSFPLMFALSLGGLVWAVRRRDPLPLLPAITWLILGVWSNPYLFAPVFGEAFRLPYAGYLDVTTLATSAWLPLALLAGYTLAQLGLWVVSLGDMYSGMRRRVWRAVAATSICLVALSTGAATGLSLSSMIDNKPYIAQADAEALVWMGQSLPRGAYVLANPFAFPWDAPPQAVQGSDAGLWVPLVAGARSSVPPIPAYNERLGDLQYLNNIREIVGLEPFEDREVDWQALKSRGVTHIYIGSRGGALDAAGLLRSDHVRQVFHKDAVWVFELR